MFKMKSLHVVLCGALLLSASALSAQITVRAVKKCVPRGFEHPAGQLGVRLHQSGHVGAGSQWNKAVKIPAGISGHKSNQMLARLERDVLKKKPQIMTLSAGVNDVWHGRRGVSLEDYRKNITEIVDKAAGCGH